jgi:hypothetical protein
MPARIPNDEAVPGESVDSPREIAGAHGRRVSLWEWPSALCLDAPVVALLWQNLAARAAGIELSWVERVLLGAAIWLIYVADHWLDAQRLQPALPALARHRFVREHPRAFALVACVVLAAGVVLSLTALPGPVFCGGVILGAFCGAYLFLVQIPALGEWIAPGKEIFSSAIFSAGVFLVPVARLLVASGSAVPLWPLWVGAGIFALLCWVNMLEIGLAEREIDRLQQQVSAADLPVAGAVTGLLLALLVLEQIFQVLTPTNLLALCLTGSTLALGVLHVLRRRLSRRTVRFLADAALLTPLVGL